MKGLVRAIPYDRAILAGLLVFGAVMFAGTFAIEAGEGGGGADVGARFAPQLFSGALMLFSALALIFSDRERRPLDADAVVGLVAVVAIVYAVALPVLGYIVSTFAALVLVLVAVRAGAWWKAIVFSAAMTGVLYFVFERIMLVGLPIGPLKF